MSRPLTIEEFIAATSGEQPAAPVTHSLPELELEQQLLAARRRVAELAAELRRLRRAA